MHAGDGIGRHLAVEVALSQVSVLSIAADERSLAEKVRFHNSLRYVISSGLRFDGAHVQINGSGSLIGFSMISSNPHDSEILSRIERTHRSGTGIIVRAAFSIRIRRRNRVRHGFLAKSSTICKVIGFFFERFGLISNRSVAISS